MHKGGVNMHNDCQDFNHFRRGEGHSPHAKDHEPLAGPFRRSTGLRDRALILCGGALLILWLTCVVARAASWDLSGLSGGMACGLLPWATVQGRNRRRNPHEKPRLAASYARYSSELQNESSLQDQHRINREKAAEQQLQIPDEFLYGDAEVSGTVRDREGLNRLLEDAAAGKFQLVLFFSLSRLARESVISLTVLKDLVYNKGVHVVCASEGLDTRNSSWEMIAAFFSVHHEQFLRDLSGHVRKGLSGTVLAQFSVGDWRYGYHSIPSPNGEQIRRGGGTSSA